MSAYGLVQEANIVEDLDKLARRARKYEQGDGPIKLSLSSSYRGNVNLVVYDESDTQVLAAALEILRDRHAIKLAEMSALENIRK